MRHRPFRLIATAAIAGAVATAPLSSAAQSAANFAALPTAAQSGISIELVHQSATTELGGQLDLRLRVTGPVGVADDLELQVVAHPSIESFDELVATATADDIEGFKDSVEFDLATLSRFSDGDVAVGIDVNDGPFDFEKLNIATPGVYPIELVVRDGSGEDLARTISWLVVTEPDAEPVVRMAWIWSLLPPPMFESDGTTPNEEFAATTHDGGELERLVDRLESIELPAAIELAPSAVDAWARAALVDPDAAASFERLRAVLATGSFDLLPVPYAPIDGPSIEAGQLGVRVPDSFLDGAQTLQDQLGIRPEPGIVHADPVDSASLDRLGATFAYRAVVDPTTVTPAPPNSTFALTTASSRFAAVATRPDLESDLGTSGAFASSTRGRRVQFLFARLALESADHDDVGPLPVVFRDGLDEPTLAALASSLGDQRLVQVVPLSGVFADSSPSDSRSLRAAPISVTTVGPLEIFEAERQRNAFVGFVGEDHPAVAEADANLRLALSRDIPAAEMRTRFGELEREINQFVAGIGTESKRVTLTDRRSQLPLSFHNDTQRRVEVRVRLSSSKLVFPDGPERVIVLPPGRNTQESFLVEARTSGTFPLEVQITSADGSFEIGAPTRITVQSAVFGSVGTWLTFGALAFLLLWWAHHFWRARRTAVTRAR